MLDLLFKSPIGKYGAMALGFAALVAWWQIDRSFAVSAGARTGRLEEKLATQEKANEQIGKAAAARDRARTRDGGLRVDPGYLGD